MIAPKELQASKEYALALEATRRDLMSGNEELREKIGALERGQVELQNTLCFVLGHSDCRCEACTVEWKVYKDKNPPCRICGSTSNVHCLTITERPGAHLFNGT